MTTTADTDPTRAPTRTTPAENTTFQTFPVTLIGLAHGIHDSYFAFIPAILPVLTESLGLTKFLAGLLSVFTQLPSFIQPFIGYLADRKNLRTVFVLSPAVSGIALSLLGISNVYLVLALLIFAAGLSSSFFHSIGPVLVGYVSGKNLGRGMSFWMMGGEFGRFIGPLAAVAAISAFTIRGLPWLMIGGLLMSAALHYFLRDVDSRHIQSPDSLTRKTDMRIFLPVLLPVWGVAASRSLITTLFNTYLPLYLTERGASLWLAGMSLSLAAAAGVVGALISGSLSDKIGRRRMLAISTALSAATSLLFLNSPAGLELPLLILMGFTVLSVNPVLMAVVLDHYPADRALANGIYMALQFVTTALAILVMGILGDRLGLQASFMIAAYVILAGLLFIWLIPRDKPTPSA